MNVNVNVNIRFPVRADEQTSRLPTGSRGASTAMVSVLLGSFTSVWWLQKVWKPQPSPGEAPPPEGGALRPRV